MDELNYRDIRPDLMTGGIVCTTVHGAVEPLGVLVCASDIGASFADPLIMTRDRHVAPLTDFLRGLEMDQIEVSEPAGGPPPEVTAGLAARLIVDAPGALGMPHLRAVISAYAADFTFDPDTWVLPMPRPDMAPVCVRMRCDAHNNPELCPLCQ